MVLNISITEAIEKMGHKRSTRTRELVAALGSRVKDKRLIPVRQRPIPEWAVLKVTWENKPRRSHFVIHFYGYIYDPLIYAGKITKHNWDLWLEGRGRVTSALKLGVGELKSC